MSKWNGLSTKILMDYIQDYGQDNGERANVLNEAAQSMGLKVNYVNVEAGCVFFSSGSTRSRQVFNRFMKDLKDIKRGEFWDEVRQIDKLLKKYTIKKWWQFWK